MAKIAKLKENIRKKEEELRKTEEQLEERLDKVHSWLGESLVDELNIDYDLLNTKKDVQEVASLITAEMKSNPFLNSESENNQEIKFENSDLNEKENLQPQNT